MRRGARAATVTAIAGALGIGGLVLVPALTGAEAGTRTAAAAGADAPALVSAGPGSLDAFAWDPATTAIVTQPFRAGGWAKASSLGGSWLYGPGAAADPVGKVLVAAVGKNQRVSVRVRTAGKWAAWTVLNGSVPAIAQPAVAALGKDRFAVVVRGTGDKGWLRTVTAGRWSGWQSLGTAKLTTAPAAAGLPGGKLGVLAAGTAGVLSTTTIDPAQKVIRPQWTSIGGKTAQTPALAIGSAGDWLVAATDPSGQVMQRQPNGNAWNWVSIAGSAGSGPALAASAGSVADLVVFAHGRILHHSTLSMPGGGYNWNRLQPVTPASTGPGSTNRITVSSTGAEANNPSLGTAVSADGRYVAFASGGTSLVPGDTNASADVFVRDTVSGTTTRVSVSSAGAQGTDSAEPTISADGRYVAFVSTGDLGQPDDNDTFQDVFVHDMKTGATTRVSVTPDGKSGNGNSSSPYLSADGSHLAFMSRASNLVPGDGNDKSDLFVRDLRAGTTVLASVATDGTQADQHVYSAHNEAHELSGDGRYAVFSTAAATLVPGDTNGKDDVFLRDLQTRTTTRLSVGPGGEQAGDASSEPTITADGRYVAFGSSAANLVSGDTNKVRDVFVRDLTAGVTTRQSLTPGGAQLSRGGTAPDLSGDGRYVIYATNDDAAAPGDVNQAGDAVVRDLSTGTTVIATMTSAGLQSEGDLGTPWQPRLSADGSVALFTSNADDLVPRDLNNRGYGGDIFVHRLR